MSCKQFGARAICMEMNDKKLTGDGNFFLSEPWNLRKICSSLEIHSLRHPTALNIATFNFELLFTLSLSAFFIYFYVIVLHHQIHFLSFPRLSPKQLYQSFQSFAVGESMTTTQSKRIFSHDFASFWWVWKWEKYLRGFEDVKGESEEVWDQNLVKKFLRPRWTFKNLIEPLETSLNL